MEERRMKKPKFKRVLSVLLSAMMIVSTLPMAASAEGNADKLVFELTAATALNDIPQYVAPDFETTYDYALKVGNKKPMTVDDIGFYEAWPALTDAPEGMNEDLYPAQVSTGNAGSWETLLPAAAQKSNSIYSGSNTITAKAGSTIWLGLKIDRSRLNGAQKNVH